MPTVGSVGQPSLRVKCRLSHPLLNYVGWFVLMVLAPLAWLLVARQRHWRLWHKAALALASLRPLALAAGGLSRLRHRLIAVFGGQ
jgi:putative membrane protein